MSGEQAKTLLGEILRCSTDDLEILDNIKYDIHSVIHDTQRANFSMCMDNILQAIFVSARDELESAWISKTVDISRELKGIKYATDDEIKQKFLMREMMQDFNPTTDMYWITNGLNTHIYLSFLQEYKEYLGTIVSELESKTGFKFEDGEED